MVEECSLPKQFPTGSSVQQSGIISFSATLLVAVATFLLLIDQFHYIRIGSFLFLYFVIVVILIVLF